MPITGTISALGAIVFAWHSVGRPATLAWLGIGLIATIMVSSIVIGAQINSRFRRLPEGQQPEGAQQLRIRWRRFHLARTGLFRRPCGLCTGFGQIQYITPTLGAPT